MKGLVRPRLFSTAQLGRPRVPAKPAVALPQTRRYTQQSTSVPAPDSRFLTNIRTRIGRCITFGLTHEQLLRAAGVLHTLATDWRALAAGADGFIARRDWAGMWRGQVRWGDMDSMSHVNNVVYNRWSETGRVGWWRNFARHHDPPNARRWTDMLTPQGTGLILKRITTEFKFSVKFPDHVTVLHRLAAPPQAEQTEFRLETLQLSEGHQRPAARGIEDNTLYDYRAGRKVALAELPFLEAGFALAWRAQVAEQERVLGERARIEAVVRALERESWDRADAQEDMGSAGPP